MSRTPDAGTTATLEVRFYENGTLFDPFNVTDVNIYDAPVGGTAVATGLTPIQISTGVYQVTWDVPEAQTPGNYYDEWSWVAADGMATKVQRYDIVVGEASLSTKIVVKDNTPGTNPIEDVNVRIYDENDVFVTAGLTDVDGEYDVFLAGDPDPGREYIVRLFKTGVIFEYPTQKIQVLNPVLDPNTNTFDFTGQLTDLPVSSTPNMCRVSGYLTDASLRDLKSAVIEFAMIPIFPSNVVSGLHFINNPTVVNGNIIAKPTKVTTDADGYLEVDLVQGALYEVFIHGWQHPDGIAERVYVPEAAGAKIEDVLFPYVASTTFDASSVSVLAGESATIGVYATGSNGQVIVDLDDMNGLLEFTSTDEAVATVAVNEGSLTITGVAAGSAVLAVGRREETNAARLPDIPAIVVPTVTITVT